MADMRAYDSTNKQWKNIGLTGDAGHVRPIPGPQLPLKIRQLVNVTARQKATWPTGSNITYLIAIVTLEATAAPTAGQEGRQVALLSLGAATDAEADGNIGLSGNPPASATTDGNCIPLPLGITVIPLTSPLAGELGGRVDVRSMDGTALNVTLIGS